MIINRRELLKSMVVGALGGLTLIGNLPEGLLASSPVPKFRTVNIWLGDELMESVQVPFVPMSEFTMDGIISKELEETMWYHRYANHPYRLADATVVDPNGEFVHDDRWSKTG